MRFNYTFLIEKLIRQKPQQQMAQATGNDAAKILQPLRRVKCLLLSSGEGQFRDCENDVQRINEKEMRANYSPGRFFNAQKKWIKVKWL